MVETITPAVCGSRRRHRIAVALFAVSAIAAAALVGLALGFAGSLVGAGTALVVAAAVLTGFAALRELGLVRVPLPQARRQVPERWHAELPLPLWSAGYGAGLGAGAFTYQPVATYWVACAAALALGRPLASAALFALYGAGRAIMVVLPRRGARATDTVEALVRRRPALVRVNGIVLAVCAVTLALAPLAGGARAMSLDLGPGNEFDPSASAGALAYTQRAKGVSQVVVRVGGATEQYAGQEPALDGDLLAYRDAAGVHVVRWSTREEIALIAGASHPALVWPWLAFRRERGDGGSEIWLRHLVKGTVRRIALAGPTLDLGRPTIGGGRVGWQVVGPKGTRIGLERISDRKRTIAVRTKIGFLAHPSLSGTRLLWVEHRPGGSSLKVRVLGKTATRTLVRTDSRTRVIWTTSLSGRTAFFTRWFSGKGIARIERVRF